MRELMSYGCQTRMHVVQLLAPQLNFIVTADIDGNFDKRGLPNPLVVAVYFALHHDLIIQLIILRNRHDI